MTLSVRKESNMINEGHLLWSRQLMLLSIDEEVPLWGNISDPAKSKIIIKSEDKGENENNESSFT